MVDFDSMKILKFVTYIKLNLNQLSSLLLSNWYSSLSHIKCRSSQSFFISLKHPILPILIGDLDFWILNFSPFVAISVYFYVFYPLTLILPHLLPFLSPSHSNYFFQVLTSSANSFIHSFSYLFHFMSLFYSPRFLSSLLLLFPSFSLTKHPSPRNRKRFFLHRTLQTAQ